MKIKFDENISQRIATALRALERDRAIEIGSVLEDYGSGMSDPQWMFRFRDENGTAMISGDHNILQNQINLVAYTESGLISIWPPAGYPRLKRFGQAALWICWWPVIKIKINQSEKGSRWRVPLSFSPNIESLQPIKDPRID